MVFVQFVFYICKKQVFVIYVCVCFGRDGVGGGVSESTATSSAPLERSRYRSERSRYRSSCLVPSPYFTPPM